MNHSAFYQAKILSSLAVLFLVFSAIFLTACGGYSQPKPLPTLPADVAKLIRDATSLCKLDVLQVEGGAAIGAYKGRESATAHSWEVSGLSQQYAQNYCDSLRKVRKFPKRIAIAELNRQFALQVPARTNQIIYQVILRHVDNIYTGMQISSVDIQQDFEAQRYNAYTPR
jgi:hypothetical protein